MARRKPTTIQQIRDDLKNNVFTRAKLLRRAIDRNKVITQITKFDGEYAKRFEAFKEAANKAAKEHGDKSRKTFEFEGKKFSISTAKRLADNKSSFRQQSYLYNKLFPELVENYQLGHQNISILRANIALALDAYEQDDPRRPALRALFVAVEQLDKIIDEENLEGINFENLMSEVSKTVNRKRSYKVEYKADIDIIQGISGVIEMEYEPIGLNQAKGRVAAFIGELFKQLVEDEEANIEKYLAGIDVTKLKGSPNMLQNLGDILTETLDPKKKAKKRKQNPRPGKGSNAGAKTQRRSRRKLNKPRRPREVKGTKSSLKLLGVLNQKLPETVRKNMIEPGLVNQTGRFASSVKVTDIAETAGGFPSIGYTYDRDNYGQYEVTSGSRFADPDRDPRKVIDESIREIAIQLLEGRLFTRRV